MKYCDRCGTQNEKRQLFCSGCGKPLTKSARLESQELAEKETALQLKKEHRQKIQGYFLLATLYLLHFALGFGLIITGKAQEMDVSALSVVLLMLLCPGGGYLSLYNPELVFKIRHFLSLRDVNQAEPSDWFMASTQISGVLLWVLGIGLLAAPWFF